MVSGSITRIRIRNVSPATKLDVDDVGELAQLGHDVTLLGSMSVPAAPGS